jgi:hypothetical protein
MFTQIDQQTLDIEWFFTDNHHVAFVASGGGKLPSSVAVSRDENALLVAYFNELPETSDAIINPGLHQIVSVKADEANLSYFVEMAKRGLFAYDRTILNNFSKTGHHLVASPSAPLNIKQLPADISTLLCKTVYRGNMPDKFDMYELNR